MKIVRVWSPSQDNLVYRVVSDERAETLRPMIRCIFTPDEFVSELVAKGAFTVQAVAGSKVGL